MSAIFASFRQLVVRKPTINFHRFCTSQITVLCAKEVEDDTRNIGPQMIRPTEFQKVVLVFGGAFKRKADIPEQVSILKMKKAGDVFRGRLTVAIVIFSFGAAYVSILLGRHDVATDKPGVEQVGTEMINKWRAEGLQEEREKAANRSTTD